MCWFNSRFHPLLSCGNSPFMLEFAFDFYVITNWRLLEREWAPLSFSRRIVAKLLCSCLCLMQSCRLHAMDGKMFNNFLIGKWHWSLYVVNASFILDLYFANVTETFITINWKAHNEYKSPSSSLLFSTYKLYFLCTLLAYMALIHSNPRKSFRFPTTSPPPRGLHDKIKREVEIWKPFQSYGSKST